MRSSWTEWQCDTDPLYPRVEQTKTSDIEFLKKICNYEGISLKVTDKQIVLFEQEKYENKPPIFTITRGCGYTKHHLDTGEAKTKYTSCRVRYKSPSGAVIEGIAVEEIIESSPPEPTAPKKRAKKIIKPAATPIDKPQHQLEVTAKVRNKAEAERLAAKRLRLANKFALSTSFTFPGNTTFVAGVTMMQKGWGYWDGKYIVRTATHTVDERGYKVQINLRGVLYEGG